MPYSAEHYQLNRERIIAAQKRYYYKTREQRLAKQKEYDATHKDEIHARYKKRKFKSKLATRIEVSNDLEDKTRCQVVEG